MSRGASGAPRVHAELRRTGRPINRKKYQRIMRERDIRGVAGRKRRNLTEADSRAAPSPDVIGRDFTADEPGRRLVGDITRLSPRAEIGTTVRESRAGARDDVFRFIEIEYNRTGLRKHPELGYLAPLATRSLPQPDLTPAAQPPAVHVQGALQTSPRPSDRTPVSSSSTAISRGAGPLERYGRHARR